MDDTSNEVFGDSQDMTSRMRPAVPEPPFTLPPVRDPQYLALSRPKTIMYSLPHDRGEQDSEDSAKDMDGVTQQPIVPCSLNPCYGGNLPLHSRLLDLSLRLAPKHTTST